MQSLSQRKAPQTRACPQRLQRCAATPSHFQGRAVIPFQRAGLSHVHEGRLRWSLEALTAEGLSRARPAGRPSRPALPTSPGEGLYAFLDDVCITSLLERTVPALRAAQASLSCLANVQVHLGKTRAWNVAGAEPAGLLARLPSAEGEPSCWTLPAREQGLVVLGSPIGSREFVAAVLAAKRDKHEELLARLPALEDLQSAWLLFLPCAAPRCNYLLRTVPPSLTDEFAAAHDAAISRCLAVLLAGGDQPIDLPPFSEPRAQLPLRMGGLGLSSAREHRHAAYWT